MRIITLVTAFAALLSLSFGAAAEDIRDYMTGDLKRLQLLEANFTMEDAQVYTGGSGDEKRVTRLSDKRGKVLLITFWKTDCVRCRTHLRRLQEVQQLVGKDKLEVIAINRDRIPFARVGYTLNRRNFDALTPVQSYGNQLLTELFIDARFDLFGLHPKTWIVDTRGEVRALENHSRDWTEPHTVALIKALAEGKI